MISSCYVHIPFCKNICAYCDFPKFCYMDKWIKPYLEALKEEIKKNYKNEVMKTIYIGGGTPSVLNEEMTKELLHILSCIKKEENCEYTIEANAEDITEEKVKLWKQYGINRVSIGIQTFGKHLGATLERIIDEERIGNAIFLLKKHGIYNINMDLMYAIPGETKTDVKEDLKKFLSFDIPHISTYSLILEPHTKLYLKKPKLIDEDLDYEMHELILTTLKEHGYKHYEISNFAKQGYESRHNLTYWNNDMYYGFGLGASSYIGKKRITNHMNLTKYLNKEFSYDEENLTEKEKMEYEMILGLRKIEGVSNSKFYLKYQKNIIDVFNIQSLLENGLLTCEDEFLKIPEDKMYLSNEILIHFLSS